MQDNFYEEPSVGYGGVDDEVDETVPFFKPEEPYRGDNKLIAKFRALTPMQQSIAAIAAISCVVFWVILLVVAVFALTTRKDYDSVDEGYYYTNGAAGGN